MEVQYIDHMGSDLSVVNCARVSFAKANTDFDPLRDPKLIKYLAQHKHWSPFSHVYVQFRFKTPMFVRNQLYKHMIGLNVGEAIGEEMGWNEVSRRYVDTNVELFKPQMWRKRAADKKQGSLDEEVDYPKVVDLHIGDWYEKCLQVYSDLIYSGTCPEQARMILPQAMYTEWIWTGSLVAWHRVVKQRVTDDTQAETREVCAQLVPILEKLFPVSWEALMNYA